MAQNYREMAPEAIGHWNASAVFLCVSLFVAPGIPSGRRDLRVVFWFFYFHFYLKVDLGRGEKKNGSFKSAVASKTNRVLHLG